MKQVSLLVLFGCVLGQGFAPSLEIEMIFDIEVPTSENSIATIAATNATEAGNAPVFEAFAPDNVTATNTSIPPPSPKPRVSLPFCPENPQASCPKYDQKPRWFKSGQGKCKEFSACFTEDFKEGFESEEKCRRSCY